MSLGTDESTSELQLSGAIFTTLVDGTRVNANIYDAKQDVYLDGGPGPNAPQHAAGLPDGLYYFQVTDPSGKTLLSSDSIEDRQIMIEDGVIVGAMTHMTGMDMDHGALTVQLYPFDDTPNPGGEYKVWVTPVEEYDEDGHGAKHGFVPRYSKTDNFKVREVIPPPPPRCGDGEKNGDEECDYSDPNDPNAGVCTMECTLPPPPPPPCCGDGKKNGDEECDYSDPNDPNAGVCTMECTLPPPPPPPPCCGDGEKNGDEECDYSDPNDPNAGVCTMECTLPPPEPPCDDEIVHAEV